MSRLLFHVDEEAIIATLTLTIGQITATFTADNTKANKLLSKFAEAIGASGTNQQKADAVVKALAQYMQDQARQYRRATAHVEALAAVNTELDEMSWIDVPPPTLPP